MTGCKATCLRLVCYRDSIIVSIVMDSIQCVLSAFEFFSTNTLLFTYNWPIQRSIISTVTVNVGHFWNFLDKHHEREIEMEKSGAHGIIPLEILCDVWSWNHLNNKRFCRPMFGLYFDLFAKFNFRFQLQNKMFCLHLIRCACKLHHHSTIYLFFKRFLLFLAWLLLNHCYYRNNENSAATWTLWWWCWLLMVGG